MDLTVNGIETATSTIKDMVTPCSRTNPEPSTWDIKLSPLATIFPTTITPPNGLSNCQTLGISTITRTIINEADNVLSEGRRLNPTLKTLGFGSGLSGETRKNRYGIH